MKTSPKIGAFRPYIALFDAKKRDIEKIALASSKTYNAHFTLKKDDIAAYLGGILSTFHFITICYLGPTSIPDQSLNSIL
jgi:hypothetical protein